MFSINGELEGGQGSSTGVSKTVMREERERKEAGLYISCETSVSASVMNSSRMADDDSQIVHEFAGFDKIYIM